MKKKEETIHLSADLNRLEEVANHHFPSGEEAKSFYKGMVLTGLAMWHKLDRNKTEETILTDTLAALMYVEI